jgi:hypothetical protein
MANTQRFAFTEIQNHQGSLNQMPYLPLTLRSGNYTLTTSGLLDTGATVNVMPYRLGLQLGAVWEQQRVPLQLAGNLAQFPAYGLLVKAQIAQFPPVDLAFAWTNSDHVPLILGQINFFMEFDVCFYRSQEFFEMSPKKGSDAMRVTGP